MIVGIGVDLVAVDRIAQAWDRFGRRFAAKILSAGEMQRLDGPGDPVAFLAKRFAAKEAVAKALGTGMRAGVHFSQIEIGRGRGGAPLVELSGAARQRAQALEVTRSHVSISDEQDHAVAFVVLESGR